ncbi:hypothetical protein JCM10212_002607 [Sporobolomyces blumeae]
MIGVTEPDAFPIYDDPLAPAFSVKWDRFTLALAHAAPSNTSWHTMLFLRNRIQQIVKHQRYDRNGKAYPPNRDVLDLYRQLDQILNELNEDEWRYLEQAGGSKCSLVAAINYQLSQFYTRLESRFQAHHIPKGDIIETEVEIERHEIQDLVNTLQKLLKLAGKRHLWKTSGQGVQAPDPDVVSGYLTLKIALDRIGRRSWETFTSTNVNDGGELRNLAAQFNGVLALFRNRMRGNARQPVNPRIYDPSLYRRTQLENLKQLMKQLWSVVGNAGEQQVWNGLFTVTRDDHGRPIWHWNDINPVRRTAHDDAQDRRPHEPEARTSPPVVPVVHSPMIVSTSLGGY